MSSSNIPFVSIVMCTYNHEKYIEAAIASVLMQKTEFSFRLFIGEDSSTDNTLSICKFFRDKHPEKIELITYAKNVGAAVNANNLYAQVTHSGSKYVAMLDGDDYWTDEYKLQKQISVLEKNTDCSICFTNVDRYTEKTDTFDKNVIIRVPDSKIFIEEYIQKGAYIPSATTLFKADLFPRKMPEWFPQVIKQDWFMYLCLLQKGGAYYMGESTAVYRVHGGGIMNTQRVKLFTKGLFLVEKTREYLYPEHQKVFSDIVSWHAADLAFAYLVEGDIGGFYKNMLKSIKEGERKSLKWYLSKTRQLLNAVKSLLIGPVTSA